MSLGDELRDVERRITEGVRKAETASLLEARDLAQQFSSGNLTSSDLARLDHPYATRHGHPLLDPDVVNRQSGAFFSSWQIDGPTPRGGGFESSLWNADAKAEMLDAGTSLMVPRHPQDKVAEVLEPHRNARLDQALDDALKG